MTAWWKKKTPQETSLLLAPLFPAPPAMRVEKSGQFTTLLAPVLDILSSHPLVDVDFGALEKTHEKDVLARNENASPRVTADEIVMTTFLNHAKMLNDHVDSSIFRPFIVAADTTNNNNNNNYDDDDTSLSFCIDMLNEIVVHDIDIVFSSVSLDDALMPPTTTTTTPTIQSPTIEFPTIDSSIPIHWLAVSCITNDNNTALAVAQLVDLLDVGIAFDASPISLTVVDSLLQFDAAVTSTTTISLAFQAVAVLQHNAMPAMAHSVARLDSTPFESLRSSLIVSLPPKSLDLTRRSPPAPARSTEERELQSHESRALPLLPIDHSPLMSVAFGDVLPPPPSLDTWNFDGAEADVLRAALLSSCRDVALRQNELPALESFVWPEPTLRFASVDVQSAVGALIDGAATWMATLPPEQAVLVDRKYRPLSVAVQNANGALVALDSVRDKRPRASLVGLVSLPATRTTQAPVPLALRRYAPAVFHCSSSVSDDLSAFLRLQRGGAPAQDDSVTLTLRALDPGLFGAWQSRLVAAVTRSDRAWLLVPAADCASNTDSQVLLHLLLESPSRRVVIVRARSSDYRSFERQRRFFSDLVVENAPARAAPISVALLSDASDATIVHADLSELDSVCELLAAAPRRSAVLLFDAGDGAAQLALCESDAPLARLFAANGASAMHRVLAMSESIADVPLARRFANRLALRTVAAAPADEEAFGVACVHVPLPTSFVSAGGEIARHGDALVSQLQDSGVLDLDAAFALLDADSLAFMYARVRRDVDAQLARSQAQLLVALATPELLPGVLRTARADATRSAARVRAVYQLLVLRQTADALVNEGALVAAAVLARSLADAPQLWTGAVPHTLVERLSVLSDEAEAGIYPSSPKLVQLVKLLEPLVAQRPRGTKLCVLLADASQVAYVANVLAANKAYTSAALDVELAPAKKLELFEWHTVTLAVATDPYVPILWPQFHVAVLYSPTCLPPIAALPAIANVIVLDAAPEAAARLHTSTVVRNLQARATDTLLVDIKMLMATPVVELTAAAEAPMQPPKKARVQTAADVENVVPQQQQPPAPVLPTKQPTTSLAPTLPSAPVNNALGNKLDVFLMERSRQRQEAPARMQAPMAPPPAPVTPQPLPVLPAAASSLTLPTFEEFRFSPTSPLSHIPRTPLIKRGRVTLGNRRRAALPPVAQSPAMVALPPPSPPAAPSPPPPPPPPLPSQQSQSTRSLEIDGLSGVAAERRLAELRATYSSTLGFRPRAEQLSFESGGTQGQTRLQWAKR